MRMRPFIVAGSVAVAFATMPALARPSEPALDAAPPLPSCSAYEQAADGSWQRLPCQQSDAASRPAPRRAATRSSYQRVR